MSYDDEFCFRIPRGVEGPQGSKGQKGDTGACTCQGMSALQSKLQSMQDEFESKLSDLERKYSSLPNVFNHCPFGMKDGRISDSQITASSFHSNHDGHAPRQARLDNTVGAGAWVSIPAEYGRGWIQVDLLTSQQVTGIITQGRGSGAPQQWVTSYKILHGNDKYNLSVLSIRGGNEIVFQGNTDRHSKVTNMFPEPINARFVRLKVFSYSAAPALRMELLGC